jgi:flagellar biosynthesis/type III secretory pathway protein FliH
MSTLKEWRCFHCDEVFKDFAEAELHFGRYRQSDPLCTLNADSIRDMEAQLSRYREEDTYLHRAIMSLEAEKAVAIRRAEEEGYARGLADSYTQTDNA